MSDGSVDVVVAWVTAVDHETVDEFHGLGTLTTQLTGHDHLAALGAALHDEAQHTVAGPGRNQDVYMNLCCVDCYDTCPRFATGLTISLRKSCESMKILLSPFQISFQSL